MQISSRGAEFPAPYWSAPRVILYLGNAQTRLQALPARSVHCVVTSPPYWGLRDYGTGQWEGGSTECDHVEFQKPLTLQSSSTLGFPSDGGPRRIGTGNTYHEAYKEQYKFICKKCGARRTDIQIGAEPSPDCGTQGQAQCGACFVCSLVGVMRDVYRVLRDDGTAWLNLGDSYAGGGNAPGGSEKQRSNAEAQRNFTSRPNTSIPTGNLIGVPWRVAFALQADGWILRQDIIWAKPSPMPESVTNRCTKSHEYIFLLAKGEGYYYDIEPIREPVSNCNDGTVSVSPLGDHVKYRGRRDQITRSYAAVCGSNKRDVWVVPTHGYTGAHFATFPPALIAPCILAGTSEHGCCAQCSRPWDRVVNHTKLILLADCPKGQASRDARTGRNRKGAGSMGGGVRINPTNQTIGWRKTCGCQTDDIAPCTVLDPFVGSGTTVATAIQLGRAGIGIDLSETYLRENAIPRIEAAIRGEKLSKPTVVIAQGTAPPVEKLRGN